MLHFRGGRKGISKTVYPELDAFFDDLAKTYKDAVAAFYKAGCRYLQFDDTVWAYLCSQKELRPRQAARRRSDPPAGDLRQGDQRGDQGPPVRHDDHHACLPRQFPLHLDLRGRLRAGRRDAVRQGRTTTAISSNTTPSGPAASSRCASCPKGNKQIVLGLVTSKSGTLEKKDDIKKRIDEATKFVALDQLCLSPQCGFASTEEGNVLTEDGPVGQDADDPGRCRKEVWG